MNRLANVLWFSLLACIVLIGCLIVLLIVSGVGENDIVTGDDRIALLKSLSVGLGAFLVSFLFSRLITTLFIMFRIKPWKWFLGGLVVGFLGYYHYGYSYVALYQILGFDHADTVLYTVEYLKQGLRHVWFLGNAFHEEYVMLAVSTILYAYLIASVNALTLFLYKDVDIQQKRMKFRLWKEHFGQSGVKFPTKAKLVKVQKMGHKQDAALVGATRENAFYLPDAALNGHSLVLGGSGFGKTTYLMNLVEHFAQQKYSVIFVDGKGSVDLKDKISRIAERFGREFNHFSLEDEHSQSYNPLRYGNFTELKDRIIAATNWSDDHYRLQAENYLQIAFSLLLRKNKCLDFSMLGKAIALEHIVALAREYKEIDYIEAIQDIDGISGLINRIQTISNSAIGARFQEDAAGMSVYDTFLNKDISLFSLSPLKFPEMAHLIGSCLINDIKSSIANMHGEKILIILDEFTTFAGKQVLDLVNKGREFGACLVLSTQVLSDLELNEGGPQLKSAVINSTNVKVIFNNTDDSVETVASLAGTKSILKLSARADYTTPESTALAGTIAEERAYYLHPDDIRNLGIGQCAIFWGFPKRVKPNFITCRYIDFSSYGSNENEAVNPGFEIGAELIETEKEPVIADINKHDEDIDKKREIQKITLENIT